MARDFFPCSEEDCRESLGRPLILENEVSKVQPGAQESDGIMDCSIMAVKCIRNPRDSADPEKRRMTHVMRQSTRRRPRDPEHWSPEYELRR